MLFHVEWERLRWNVYELRTMCSWFFKLKLMPRMKHEGLLMIFPIRLPSYPFPEIRSAGRGYSRHRCTFCLLLSVHVSVYLSLLDSFSPRNSKETPEDIREFDTFHVSCSLCILIVTQTESNGLNGSRRTNYWREMRKQFHQLHRRFINNSWCTISLFG